MSSYYQRVRILQIRRLSSLLIASARLPLLRRCLRGLMSIAPACKLVHALLGYRRPFTSLAQATQVGSQYLSSHETPENITVHLTLGEKARPSDYTALFYLRGLLEENTTVLDVGGNAGNLFYCYSRYLS